ncbi:PP2C family protein-serine/threonine phosphatase [Solitalea koreensis]|uniref:Sigma-B regulation protein RsbU (Phosphoserine phosphatase) n=1 Tax=Solitalea koreensis TaxID=543615 RepID=A0A521AQW1_9SPHI|nr:PP2C family protein-serine/threonine phosphatase [Solitalea koreensis]SMO37040.1 sigma-B regulation protein RsbU (phosphoserine phosphatase) [Solitalea koreensis]
MNQANDQQDILELLIKRQVELNSLLEITRAVNSNQSKETLFQMTELILRNQLRVGKLRIFSHLGASWTQPISYGVQVLDDDELAELIFMVCSYQTVTLLDTSSPAILSDFQLLIPVAYKNQILGYVLLGKYDVSNAEQVEIDVKLIQTIINVIMVAAENRHLYEERLQKERLQRDLEVASEAQEMLLPRKLPDNERISMAATYMPHRNIGGDYYDYIELSKDEFMFCVADVSGKGIAAALLMANFQASVRTLAFQHQPLDILMQNINRAIFDITHGEKHITLFLGYYNLATRTLRYVNSGHNAPVLYNGTEIKELKTGSMMIGIFEELPFVKVGTEQLPSGSVVLNYTDGLIEFDQEETDVFNEEDVAKFLLEHHELGPKVLNALLIDKIQSMFIRHRHDDDITLLTFKTF